jgi:hypothetical protein
VIGGAEKLPEKLRGMLFEFIDVYTSICKDTVDGTDLQSE